MVGKSFRHGRIFLLSTSHQFLDTPLFSDVHFGCPCKTLLTGWVLPRRLVAPPPCAPQVALEDLAQGSEPQVWRDLARRSDANPFFLRCGCAFNLEGTPFWGRSEKNKNKKEHHDFGGSFFCSKKHIGENSNCQLPHTRWLDPINS